MNSGGEVTIAECVACAGLLCSIARLTAETSARTATEAAKPVLMFLGGSCNPTTWRKDIAIPAFEAAAIGDAHYYNP